MPGDARGGILYAPAPRRSAPHCLVVRRGPLGQTKTPPGRKTKKPVIERKRLLNRVGKRTTDSDDNQADSNSYSEEETEQVKRSSALGLRKRK